MGLDQYLYARRYASRTPGFGSDVYEAIIKAVDAEKIADAEWGGVYTEVCVGYWRKANHIHRWFVENCQGSVDDCREAYVSREQLAQLRDLCKAVIAEPARASEFLPTTSGFFFGGTEYDDWYFADTEHTVEMIDRLLSDVSPEWDFQYSSSW